MMKKDKSPGKIVGMLAFKPMGFVGMNITLCSACSPNHPSLQEKRYIFSDEKRVDVYTCSDCKVLFK